MATPYFDFGFRSTALASRNGITSIALQPRLLARVCLCALVTFCLSGCVDPENAGKSRYVDVASLAENLTEAGIGCDLAYEGLEDGDREISTCEINGEFAFLQIWKDEAVLTEFLAATEPPESPQVHGLNWVIDVETDSTANQLAETLSGTVRSPNP